MLFKKLLIALLVIIVILLLVRIYLPGISKYNELKSEDAKLTKEIEKVKALNAELQKEEELLRNDIAYLEEVIRKNLGVVKPGEVVYKVVPEEETPETENNPPSPE